MGSMSRFNPARMSIKSRTSSNRMENDLTSLNELETDTTNNTTAILNDEDQQKQQVAKNNKIINKELVQTQSPFIRRNSSRFQNSAYNSKRSFKSAQNPLILNGNNHENSEQNQQKNHQVLDKNEFFEDNFVDDDFAKRG